MSQHDFILDNATGASFRTDLNNALAAGVSLSSGASAPATTYAYQFWADTTTGILKMRNAANDAWITVGKLSNLWDSPTLITPALGTPSSGALDNCTSNTKAANNNSTQLATTAYADRLTAGTLAGAFTTLSASGSYTNFTAANAQIQTGTATTYGYYGNNVGQGGMAVYGSTHATLPGVTQIFNAGSVIAQTSSTGLAVTGTIKGSTTIGVGNATPAASGAGITFPATQSASSDANTLDDYEDGTWTPGQGSGLTVVGAFSSSGRYTKIGRSVTINGTLAGATSIATTSGTQFCTALPFTVGENAAVGAATNAAITATGVVSAFTTQMYSATTIGATAAIDFSCTYTV